MNAVKFLEVLFFVLVGALFSMAQAAQMTLEEAQWKGCTRQGRCFTLAFERGGQSDFLPRLFIQNVRLTIYSPQKKIVRQVKAQRGFLMQDQKTWALMATSEGKDVYLDTDSVHLSALEPSKGPILR